MNYWVPVGIIKVQLLFLSVSALFKKRHCLKAGISSVSGNSTFIDVKMIQIFAGPSNCHCKLDKVAVGFKTAGGGSNTQRLYKWDWRSWLFPWPAMKITEASIGSGCLLNLTEQHEEVKRNMWKHFMWTVSMCKNNNSWNREMKWSKNMLLQMEKQYLRKYSISHHWNRQAMWTFTGSLAVQISWKPMGTNSRGETMSSVTLTKAPEAKQAQWFCSEASRTKCVCTGQLPGVYECVCNVTFFLLVNNNTFLSEMWSPSNFGSSVSDDFWLTRDVCWYAQSVALTPVSTLSCHQSLMLNR